MVQLENQDPDFIFLDEDISTDTFEELTIQFNLPPGNITPENFHIRSNKDATLLQVLHISNSENTIHIHLNENTPMTHETSYNLSIIGDIYSKNDVVFTGEKQYDFVSYIPKKIRENWLTNDFITQANKQQENTDIDRLPDTGNTLIILLIIFTLFTGIYAAIKMNQRLS